MIEYIVQNYYPFKKNRSDEEKKAIGLAMSLLSSSIADFDVVTDWIYFTEIATRNDDFIIPSWILTLQLVSCICGSIAWACIASDGWVFDMLRRGCKWIILGPMWIVAIIFYVIPLILLDKCCGYDLENTWYGDLFDKLHDLKDTIKERFDSGMHVSSGMLLFLGILVEDVPQLIVTSLVEGIYGPGGGFSDSAKLNLIVSVLDIFHKLAQAYDDRDVLFKTGDGSDMTLFGHQRRVRSLALTESNHLLSASWDATTKLWDLTSGKVVRTFKALGDHNGVAMLINEKFVVAAKEGLTIFSTNSSDVEKEIKTNEEVLCVAASIEDECFLAGTKSAIIKYDSNSYEERDRFGDEGASHIAILDSEHFVSGKKYSLYSSSKKCSLWSMTDKTSQEITLAGTFHCVCKVNPSLFLTGSYKGIQLWDADNLDQCTKTFGTDETCSLGIISDDLFVSGVWYPGVAELWNIESGACLATFKGHTYGIEDVVYLPEQKAIATASSDKSIKVWPIGQYLEKANEGEDNNDNNDSNNADDHV